MKTITQHDRGFYDALMNSDIVWKEMDDRDGFYWVSSSEVNRIEINTVSLRVRHCGCWFPVHLTSEMLKTLYEKAERSAECERRGTLNFVRVNLERGTL
jgi:hypothetical protein